MIVGIGTDIVSIARLEKAFGRIAERCFTQLELENSAASAHRMEHLAGRWAAKEALAKALGCGFGESCSWQDIEITNLASGQPVMHLSNRTLKSFEALGGKTIHLSISHEKEYASAFVILES